MFIPTTTKLGAAAVSCLLALSAGCGDDGEQGQEETGEHVVLLRGALRDPATARETHDTGAVQAEPGATSVGDQAHIVGLGASIFSTDPTDWLAIDRWSGPDPIDSFYSDPGFEAGLDAVVADSTIEPFRRQTTWHEWGSYDGGSGQPRWYVLVRGRLADPATAQESHDVGAERTEAAATAAGDVAHLVFTGRDDEAEFLAIDIWTDPAALEAFYSDPAFQSSAGDVFEGAPTLQVYHATDWHQWGSPGTTTLDGAWRIASLTCTGQAQTLGEFVFEVRGAAGTFTQTFDPGCVARYDETYAYTAPDEFEITAHSVSCDPSDSCMAILGVPCLPAPPPTPFTWQVSQDSLQFVRTAEGPGDLPCQPGDAMEFTMSRASL